MTPGDREFESPPGAPLRNALSTPNAADSTPIVSALNLVSSRRRLPGESWEPRIVAIERDPLATPFDGKCCKPGVAHARPARRVSSSPGIRPPAALLTRGTIRFGLTARLLSAMTTRSPSAISDVRVRPSAAALRFARLSRSSGRRTVVRRVICLDISLADHMSKRHLVRTLGIALKSRPFRRASAAPWHAVALRFARSVAYSVICATTVRVAGSTNSTLSFVLRYSSDLTPSISATLFGNGRISSSA